jgi:hypothetical protein
VSTHFSRTLQHKNAIKICSVVLELLYVERWIKDWRDRNMHGESHRCISVTYVSKGVTENIVKQATFLKYVKENERQKLQIL